jgi:MFS family permease
MSMTSTNLGHSGQVAITDHRHEGGPIWLSAMAGLCASLVGLGLARFAYTPLIPALIAAKWFSPAEAVYLGAANLAGYLAGALIARELGSRAGSVRSLRAMMVLASLSAFACSVPISFIWFFGWRFLTSHPAREGLSAASSSPASASALRRPAPSFRCCCSKVSGRAGTASVHCLCC